MIAPRIRRVLVVDDQPVYRRAVAAVLGGADGFELVAEAGDAGGARRAAVAEPLPDVAIVDVFLGDDDGIALCRDLRALRPDLAVVLVSTADRADLPDDVVWSGAAGFIPKARFGYDELVRALDGPSSTDDLRCP